MRVVIAGGGTAGHVLPALEVARVLARRGAAVRFIGTADGQEATLVPAAGFRIDTLEAVRLRRSLSPRNLLIPLAMRRSVAAARRMLDDVDVVLGMGGYVSLPVGLAARGRRIPLVVHEQNAVAGLANRLLARIADRVAVTFEGTRLRTRGDRRPLETGDPVRRPIIEVGEARDGSLDVADARRRLGLDPELDTVVAFGGSLGAVRIVEAALGAMSLLGERPTQLLLLTGRSHLELATRSVAAPVAQRVHLRDALSDMDQAYAAATLVVARAGAGTCAEVLASRTPAILVPYPHATADHQTANARELERAGAVEVIVDGELAAPLLAARLARMLDDPDRLATMSAAAAATARPDAAERLADLVTEAAGEPLR